jgi:hypothetical protein
MQHLTGQAANNVPYSLNAPVIQHLGVNTKIASQGFAEAVKELEFIGLKSDNNPLCCRCPRFRRYAKLARH